jgi:hypothetical protein
MTGPNPQAANGGRDPEMERALACVPRPKARPEFEQKLRAAFVAATPRPANVPLEDTLEPPPSPRAWAHARRANRYMWAGLAAAILIAVVLVYWKPIDDRWHVLDGTAPGVVRIDGVAFRTEDRDRLSRSLVDARQIATDGTLRIQLGRYYLLELDAGGTLTINPIEQRSGTEPLVFVVERGTLRIAIGPGLVDKDMSVSTIDGVLHAGPVHAPHAASECFAVDKHADGTCFCCEHGPEDITAVQGELKRTMNEDTMCYVYHDGHEMKTGPITPAHLAALHNLEDCAHRIWD